MATIEVNQITKTFASTRVVDQVSFTVEPGEIFGLLGPNGAGKTTTIRIILDIYKPDTGQVHVLGGAMTEAKKSRIGYLPEERGLYQDVALDRTLIYLATLKGLSTGEAKKRVGEYLEMFDLAKNKKMKIKELSKGMQQKAQLIVTLVHKPEILIIDEPFSALDPVNTRMVKELLLEERKRGTSIIICTHQMFHADELCERLVLINKGKAMLYGTIDEVRKRFSGKEVLLKTSDPLPENIAGVESIDRLNGRNILHLTELANPQVILQELVERNIPIEKFEIAIPTLDDVFIQVVNGQADLS